MVDLSQLAVGGATRPDSFTGMNPAFASALAQMFAAAPPEIQSQLRVTSGYRSPERQAQLWDEALKKYGSESAARKWVAPPGRSKHNHGHAADLKYLDDAARAWAHANAPNFGLAFPLANENWHIELASARGGQPAIQAAAPGPQTQPARSFGDVVAPQAPAAKPNLASVVAQMMQGGQQSGAADMQAAEQERRAALLGLYV